MDDNKLEYLEVSFVSLKVKKFPSYNHFPIKLTPPTFLPLFFAYLVNNPLLFGEVHKKIS
jgi:hypothetical protein